MSVSKGSFLRRHLSKPNRRSLYTLLSVLLFVTMFGAVAFSRINWSGTAALRVNSDRSLSRESDAVRARSNPESQGPLQAALGRILSLLPFQACELGCNASVPATGTAGSSVSFSANATSNGCAAQPTYEWNFGDGTARSTEQNPSHTYALAGNYNWTLTTSIDSGATTIETVAGGLGEGNSARQSPLGSPAAVTRDPAGRGVFMVDTIDNHVLVRFLNTGASAVTLGGTTIAPGTLRVIAGGGLTNLDASNNNVPALQADLGVITGLGVNATGELVYLANSVDDMVLVINLSGSSQVVGSTSIEPNRVGILAKGFGQSTGLSGLAVNAATGDVLVTDVTPGVNKVFKVTPAGAITVVAGSGAITTPKEPFAAGTALSVKLLQPRAVRVTTDGNLIISDTGHGRVIRVDGSGNATLVHQFPLTNLQSEDIPNPYPSGLALQGANIYSANGNRQSITRLTNGVAVVAGTPDAEEDGLVCDYTSSNCGDGGPGSSAQFNLAGSTANPALAGMDGDDNGLFILDQGVLGRGRLRYLNLSNGPATIAGVTIASGAIDTIAGNGLISPYDGGLATSASFNTPVGLAADANGNLWVSDTVGARLRFINRGAAPVTIFADTDSAQSVAPGSIVTVNKNVGTVPSDSLTVTPVISASFKSPQGLFATSQGLYVADSANGPCVPPNNLSCRRTSLIRFINTGSASVTLFPGSSSPIAVPPGQIATIGGGASGGIGNNGPARSAVFIGVSDLVVKSDGTVYVTDVGQGGVRRIDGNTGDVTGVATLANVPFTGLGLDSGGRVYVADYDGGNVLRETAPGSNSFEAIATGLIRPRDVAVDADGDAFVTVAPAPLSGGSHQIVRISASGSTSVLAGGTPGFSGDGGVAAAAQINISPSELVVGQGPANLLQQTVNIVVLNHNEILFTDSNNNRIRRLSSSLVTCVKTGTINISGEPPAPTLASLSPDNALQSSAELTLTVTGSGFVTSSVVRWNGQDRPTSYVSSTQLTATIPATDLINPGSALVTVFTPAPGGGLSNRLTFRIKAFNAPPYVMSVTPNSAREGSAAFEMTVLGTGFINGSVVRLDGQDRQTTFDNNTKLRAQIPAEDLVGVGTATITVFNPAPGGGVSNLVAFSITSPNGPTITAINPATVAPGSGALNLTIDGTSFVSGCQVRVDGNDRPTVFVSSTQVQVAIPAEDVANPAFLNVTVFNPDNNPSNPVTLKVGSPVATVSAASFLTSAEVAPGSIVAGFGPLLATGVQAAPSIPLPMSLLGTSVRVSDSQGVEFDAPLFYVSPQQVNYQMPLGVALGDATVRVLIDNVIVATGVVHIVSTAPGLFTFNASGAGLAAGVALRIRGDQATYEPIFDGTNPIPIDLGSEQDQVYLILFGTGLGGGTASVTIDGVNVPVAVFAAPDFIGLDQCNVGPIPRSLSGRGSVNVVLTVDGRTANTVQVSIK